MDVTQLAHCLDTHLRTETFPLGVMTSSDAGRIPAKAKLPRRDLGVPLALCQGVSIARKYGWTVAFTGDEISCPVARVTFGFAEALDYYTEGNLAAGMYSATCEAGARFEKALSTFTPGERAVVVVGPLSRIDFDPDSVLVYGNPAQILRLVNAALYQDGGALASEFSGRADCTDLIIKPDRTGQPQVVLPCYGDRVFAMTADHEMAFTFPFALADKIAAGLEGTARGGIRYPIPQFLRFEALFPPSYQELERQWQEQLDEKTEPPATP